MQEKSRRGTGWRRLLAEGVVIVVSILLAFGIDAWWSTRTDRLQARALTRALADDFVTAKRVAEQVRVLRARAFAAAERLLTYSEAGAVPEAEKAQADSAFSRLFYSMVTFDPPMGTVETILSSGRLDLFEDRNLVGELTRWTSTVVNYKTWEAALTASFYQRLVPFLGERVDLQDLDRAVPWQLPWPHDPTSVTDLVSDTHFRSILYMHYVLLRNTSNAFPAVEQSIDRIAAMTAEELER